MNKANKSAYSAEGYRPKIKKLISLENIRMLYGFMYELEYQIEFSENGKSLDNYFSGNKTREVLGRYKADLEKTVNSDLCESVKEQKSRSWRKRFKEWF